MASFRDTWGTTEQMLNAPGLYVPKSYKGPTQLPSSMYTAKLRALKEMLRLKGKPYEDYLSEHRTEYPYIQPYDEDAYNVLQNRIDHEIDEYKTEVEEYKDQADWDERDYYAHVRPSLLKLKDSKGMIRDEVDKFYREMRALGKLDEAGDLRILGSKIPSRKRLHANPTKKHVPKLQDTIQYLFREGMFKYDPETETYTIPKSTLKQIDPYYKDYINAMTKLFEGISEDYTTNMDYENAPEQPPENAGPEVRQALRYRILYPELANNANDDESIRFRKNLREHGKRDLAKILPLRALLNINKSANKDRALNELLRGISELPDELTKKSVRNLGMHSMNEFRERLEEARQRQEQKEYALAREREVREAMDNAAHKEHEEPFIYSQEVQDVVNEFDGWSLPKNNDELIARGNECNNCLKKAYMRWPEHIRGTVSKNERTLVLFHGHGVDAISAEIALTLDEDGIVQRANLLQIRRPNNKTLIKPSLLLQQAEDIAKELIGVDVTGHREILNDMQEDHTSQGLVESDMYVKDIRQHPHIKRLVSKWDYDGDPLKFNTLLSEYGRYSA